MYAYNDQAEALRQEIQQRSVYLEYIKVQSAEENRKLDELRIRNAEVIDCTKQLREFGTKEAMSASTAGDAYKMQHHALQNRAHQLRKMNQDIWTAMHKLRKSRRRNLDQIKAKFRGNEFFTFCVHFSMRDRKTVNALEKISNDFLRCAMRNVIWEWTNLADWTNQTFPLMDLHRSQLQHTANNSFKPLLRKQVTEFQQKEELERSRLAASQNCRPQSGSVVELGQEQGGGELEPCPTQGSGGVSGFPTSSD